MPGRRPNRLLDFLSGTFAQILQVGGGIIILPLVARELAPAELTMWYLFLTIQTITILIEFGFTPTFTRNFAYVMAGADSLQKEGVPADSGSGVNTRLLASLLRAARQVYAYLAAIVGVVVVVFGTAFIYLVGHKDGALGPTFIAWAIFAASLIAQTYMNWQTCVIVGNDRMRQQYQILTISKLAQIILSVAALLLAPGVIGLCVAFAVSLALRQFLAMAEVARVEALAADVTADKDEVKKVLSAVTPNALQVGWSTFGEFLTGRFGFLVVAAAAGATMASSYAIAIQVTIALLMMAQLISITLGSRLSAARVAGDRALTSEIFALGFVFAVTAAVIGGAILVFAGPALMSFIGSKTSLPDTLTMAVMCAAVVLDVILHTSKNAIMTSNKTPWVRAVLISGGVTAIAILVASQFTHDVIAFVLIQAVVQLSFNYWRWPLLAFKELGVHPAKLLPLAIAGGRRALAGGM